MGLGLDWRTEHENVSERDENVDDSSSRLMDWVGGDVLL